ncbi:hypothetical protein BT93_K1256 [Corymbia citriodora subsp. variegata]|nr:hypothetical protein BT93_K1256 [Corymbia citriodora subsp. variegata]
MQMAKLFAALHNYQSHEKLFCASILTSLTIGKVTVSFGMFKDIITMLTLHCILSKGSQAIEYLLPKGLFSPIAPCNPLKGVLSELFKLHAFFSFGLKFTY